MDYLKQGLIEKTIEKEGYKELKFGKARDGAVCYY